MRTTGPDSGAKRQRSRSFGFGFSCAVLILCAAPLPAADGDTPFPALADLASALSRSDSGGALEIFDNGMKEFPGIETAIGALLAQAEVLCAIDVVEEKASDAESRTLDLDWYMQLKSRAPSGPTERRRQRVTVAMKKLRGKWRIVSLSPLSILSPITIH